jgi:hypothetical protein
LPALTAPSASSTPCRVTPASIAIAFDTTGLAAATSGRVTFPVVLPISSRGANGVASRPRNS